MITKSSYLQSTEISTDINFIPIQASLHELTSNPKGMGLIHSRTQRVTDRDGEKNQTKTLVNVTEEKNKVKKSEITK